MAKYRAIITRDDNVTRSIPVKAQDVREAVTRSLWRVIEQPHVEQITLVSAVHEHRQLEQQVIHHITTIMGVRRISESDRIDAIMWTSDKD